MNQKGSSEDESDNEEVPSLIETEKEFSIMKNKESLKGPFRPSLDLFRKISTTDLNSLHFGDKKKKQYLTDFERFMKKKQQEKSEFHKNDEIEEILKVEEQKVPLGGSRADRYARIQFELKRKLKLQSKSKEAKFNSMFGIFKQLDTFVDIKPFLHDLNQVNNSKYYESIKDLKAQIAEKQSQKELDEMFDEVQSRISTDEVKSGSSNTIQNKSMGSSFKQQKLLQESNEQILQWKKNHNYNVGLMSSSLIEHFSQSNHTFKALVDANDPEIDSQQFYDILSKQLFSKKNMPPQIGDLEFVTTLTKESQDTDDYIGFNEIKPKNSFWKHKGDDVQLTEEEKLKRVQEDLQTKLLTSDGLDRDSNKNFTDQEYFQDYQSKAQQVRKNLQRVSESLFKQKWANANIKLKKVREEEYKKVMSSLSKAKDKNFEKIYFPSKNSFRAVFKGKEVKSRFSFSNTPSSANLQQQSKKQMLSQFAEQAQIRSRSKDNLQSEGNIQGNSHNLRKDVIQSQTSINFTNQKFKDLSSRGGISQHSISNQLQFPIVSPKDSARSIQNQLFSHTIQSPFGSHNLINFPSDKNIDKQVKSAIGQDRNFSCHNLARTLGKFESDKMASNQYSKSMHNSHIIQKSGQSNQIPLNKKEMLNQQEISKKNYFYPSVSPKSNGYLQINQLSQLNRYTQQNISEAKRGEIQEEDQNQLDEDLAQEKALREKRNEAKQERNDKFNTFLNKLDVEQLRFDESKPRYSEKIKQLQERYQSEIVKFQDPQFDSIKTLGQAEELVFKYRKARQINIKAVNSVIS